jgi:hypothetical protein
MDAADEAGASVGASPLIHVFCGPRVSEVTTRCYLHGPVQGVPKMCSTTLQDSMMPTMAGLRRGAVRNSRRAGTRLIPAPIQLTYVPKCGTCQPALQYSHKYAAAFRLASRSVSDRQFTLAFPCVAASTGSV